MVLSSNGEEAFLADRDAMFASESQSPIITSIGSVGWFEAKVLNPWRLSEAEPDAPVKLLDEGLKSDFKEKQYRTELKNEKSINRMGSFDIFNVLRDVRLDSYNLLPGQLE